MGLTRLGDGEDLLQIRKGLIENGPKIGREGSQLGKNRLDWMGIPLKCVDD